MHGHSIFENNVIFSFKLLHKQKIISYNPNFNVYLLNGRGTRKS